MHLTLPRNDLARVGLKEWAFGVSFIQCCLGLVFHLGWINVGFRFWPPNGPSFKTKEELDKWAEELVERRFANEV